MELTHRIFSRQDLIGVEYDKTDLLLSPMHYNPKTKRRRLRTCSPSNPLHPVPLQMIPYVPILNARGAIDLERERDSIIVMNGEKVARVLKSSSCSERILPRYAPLLPLIHLIPRYLNP